MGGGRLGYNVIAIRWPPDVIARDPRRQTRRQADACTNTHTPYGFTKRLVS